MAIVSKYRMCKFYKTNDQVSLKSKLQDRRKGKLHVKAHLKDILPKRNPGLINPVRPSSGTDRMWKQNSADW